MKFTLRQLQVFETLADTRHFGRAAVALNRSQPTISADLRALEAALDLRLFDRSRGGTVLTDAGQALLPLAQRVLRESSGLVAEAKRIRNGTVQVRLAATPSLVNRLVPAVLHALEEAGSALRVEVVEVDTGDVEAALTDGRADVGVGHHLVLSDGMEGAAVARDELCVLASGVGLDPTTGVDLTTLAGRELLIWPREKNPIYFDAIIQACRDRGLNPLVKETSSRFSGSQSYHLTEGDAFCLVPFDFAREAPRSFSYAPIEPPVTVPLQAVWCKPAVEGALEVVDALARLRRGPRHM